MKNYKFTCFFFFICLLTFSTASAQTARKKVACIGNSITQGIGLTFHRAQAYPTLLYDFLDENEFEINNYGVSGFAVMHNSNNPYWNTGQYQNILEWKPDIVTIKLGTNDTHSYNWDAHKAEFEGDYRELVNSFKSLDSHPEIYLCLPVPIFPEGGVQSNVLMNEVLPVIRKIADETGSTIIDLHTPFKGRRDLFADDLHPNVKGARLLTYLIAQAIDPEFEENPGYYAGLVPFVLPFDQTDKYTEINSSVAGLDAAPLIDNDGSTVLSAPFQSDMYFELKLAANAKISSYTITASNSSGAPSSWELQVLTGSRWSSINTQKDILFQANETRPFTISASSYSALRNTDTYRLAIKAINGGSTLNIGEWQLFGCNFSRDVSITSNGGTITDQYNKTDNEGVQFLNDKKFDTKYYVGGTGASFWIKYVSTEPANITRYALTSANDFDERDPSAWTLEASNDGETWDTLDIRSAQHFFARFNTREYAVTNGKENTKYTHFKLNVNKTVSNGRTFQLAEWQLYSDYEPLVPINDLYVVGGALDCGWVAENAYPMEKEENGVFTWTGNMKSGDFKFLLKTTPSDVWINCLNAKTPNEKVILGKAHEWVYVENSRETGGDYKFMMNEEGAFKIVVDTKKRTMTVSKSDLISVSQLDGKGKRIVNIHSCSGKTNDEETPYKLLIGKDENLKSNSNKWAYNGENPWVIFSLSGIYSINKFGFRDGRIRETGTDVRNVPEYKVYVSVAGTNDEDWVEVIHETQVGDLDEKVKAITPVEARFIKFVPLKDADDPYVRIYGVDIYGTFVRPLNEEIISAGKTIVDYSSCWGHRETPANILDGNSAAVPGEDANNPWAFAKSSSSAWVIIDLESSAEIEKFILTDSQDWITGCKLYAAEFVGKDEDWNLIFDGSFEKETVRKEGIITQPATGRYLKLEIPADCQQGISRIRELEIYGNRQEKPAISTGHADIKAAYELALWTVDLNTTYDGILKAGARYDGKWTRDLSINVWNGYAFLQPEIAKNSLLSLLGNDSKQLIGAEYWDKIIWVKGAYEYYLATGDREFLNQVWKSGYNTIRDLESMKQNGSPVFDAEYGLFTGPSVFNDGIAGYEVPVFDGDERGAPVVGHPAYNRIKCLSTNCIYYEAYRLLAKVAAITGNEAQIPELEEKAASLKSSIRTHLFNEGTGKLNYLIDQNGTVHPHQEGLGVSFAILFDIVSLEEAQKIVDEALVTEYGLPSIAPHFARFNDDKPGRHNRMIWPFVNAFWADACLKAGNWDKYDFELFNLIDLAIDKGQGGFWEIYDPKTGLPDGGWQGGHWGELENQTWSATGFLNMVWHGLAGIRPEENKIRFKPYLPQGIEYLTLTQLKYGNEKLNIRLEGEGATVETFKVNGQLVDSPEIERNAYSGDIDIEIKLKKGTSGLTPPASGQIPFTAFSKNASVYIQQLNPQETGSFKLYDMTGKIVASKENAAGNFTLAGNLSKGIFILKMECEHAVYTKKLVVF
jgi:lysophospholipase L1-like esterase